MKVLMVDNLVGNEYSLILCSHLSKLGLETSLVVVEDRQIPFPVHFPLYRWAPSKTTKRNKVWKLWKYWKYLFSLTKITILRKFDVVHFQFLRRERPESLLLLLLSSLKVPWVITAHNILPHENTYLDHVLKAFCYKAAGLIIVHSKPISIELHHRFNIPLSKIRVIPHGDFDIYLPKHPLSKNEARKKLGLCENDSVLLFFGYIREYKGLDLLLDAFQLVYDSCPAARLLIAGKPHSKELENHYLCKIKGMHAGSAIVFHPRFISPNDVCVYFTAADLVVLPYRRIDHSGILHLAYTFGLPVVATDVGDFKETIEAEKTGYVLKENNVEMLAATLLKALSSPQELKTLGMQAKRLSETKYTWQTAAILTSKAYDEFLESLKWRSRKLVENNPTRDRSR